MAEKKEKFTRIFILLFAKINITRFKIYILRDKILKSTKIVEKISPRLNVCLLLRKIRVSRVEARNEGIGTRKVGVQADFCENIH